MLSGVQVNKNDNKMVPIETERRCFDVESSNIFCKFELFESVGHRRSPGCIANYTSKLTFNKICLFI